MRTIGRWKTGKPPEPDYYLVSLEGSKVPRILYWNGSGWEYENPVHSRYRIAWDYLPADCSWGTTGCLWGTK